MGMYTQIRGWLNVDSIAYGRKNFDAICERLKEAQQSFIDSDDVRAWVCNHTTAMQGGNGSAFIFFGSELKNYNDDAETWIRYLLDYFPNAEGRIDFQYEEEYPNDEYTSKYWLIYKGAVIEEGRCKTWCYGYGNSWEDGGPRD